MKIRRFAVARRSAGQSMVETALLLPLLLLIVLNAVNFGYFLVVALNLAAAPRSGVEYSIQGFETPATLALPPPGPPATVTSVSYLTYQDLTGAVSSPTGASLQVCSKILGLTNAGLATQKAKCSACTGTSCAAATTGSPAPDADPESPSFVLHRVDVTYSFSPIIPGTPFGIALLPTSICTTSGSTVTCTFHRQVSMRAMD
jgi:hypothetical protein